MRSSAVMLLVRYGLVQLAAYAVDMGCYVLLYKTLGLDPVLANIVGKLISAVLSFIAHWLFTFRMQGQGDVRWQATRYFSLVALNTPLSSGILSLLLPFVPSPVAAKFAADVLCTGISYLITRLFVFTPTGGSAPERSGEGE